MKKSEKEQWLRDLRSGEFRQGTGSLMQHGASGFPEYCCLGVYAQRKTDLSQFDSDTLSTSDLTELDTHNPDEDPVMFDPSMTGLSPETCSQLAQMNDGLVWNGHIAKEGSNEAGSPVPGVKTQIAPRMSFEQIADWIQENIPEESDWGLVTAAD